MSEPQAEPQSEPQEAADPLADPLADSLTTTMRKLEAKYPGFAVWCVAGGAEWYARRAGEITKAERRTGNLLPILSAPAPGELETLIQQAQDAGWTT